MSWIEAYVVYKIVGPLGPLECALLLPFVLGGLFISCKRADYDR